MRNFMLLALLLITSVTFSSAVVVQHSEYTDLQKTISVLLTKFEEQEAKIEEQHRKIAQLESLLKQHLQTISQDNKHSISKRAVSLPTFPVAFSVRLLHTQITHAKGTIIKFDEVTVNDGGGYRAPSGVFIAPQAGLYFFTWMFLPEPGYVGTMGFFKNGVMIRQSDSVSPMAGNSVIIRLNFEDQVWLATYRDVDGIHENHSDFSGFRISD